jgi:hypothetical protein
MTLADALRALGTPTSTRTATRVLRHLLCSCPGDDPLSVIVLMAEHLDRLTPAIDYARRRRLRGAELLPDSVWRRLATLIDASQQDGSHGLARSWLYARITGCDVSATLAGVAPQYLSSRIGAFLPALRVEFVSAADQYALEFLKASGIGGEPVTWSPDYPLEPSRPHATVQG